MGDLVTQRRAKNVALMYHDKDVKLKEQLRKHLTGVQRNGYIKIIESASQQNMPSLDIILALLSSDFIQSDKHVNALHFANDHTNACVVLIILQEINLQRDLPALAGKQSLPRNGRPVINQNRDQAFNDITNEIYKLSNSL